MARGGIDATRNYYADLGVPANASEGDIRKAFRKLALECHPDRHTGQEQEWVAKFQQIQEAYEILSDPHDRARYDAERRKFRTTSMNIPPFNPNAPRRPPPPRNAYTTTPNGPYRQNPPRQPPPRPPPPQHHSTYTHGAGRFAGKNFKPPPTAQKPDARNEADARTNAFTAWQKMKQPRGSPRNNPNGNPFGRSQSTQVPSSSKKGFDPAAAGADEGQARSAYRSNYERPRPSTLDEEMSDDVPYAEANRVRTPYSSAKPGERTSMFGDGVGRSASVRNSPTHWPSSSVDAGFHSDSGRRQQRPSYGGSAKKNADPFPHMYISSSDEEEAVPTSSKGKKTDIPPSPKQSSQQPSTAGQGIFGTTPQTKGASPTPFKSRSDEGINMKFSPGAWSGKFEGKPDYFAPAPQKGGASKARMSPSRGRSTQRSGTETKPTSGQSQPPPVSPFTQSQFPNMPPPPPGPPPVNTQLPNGSESAPHTAKFEPGEWAETFKEPSWAYPKETSPRRGSAAPPKRANLARKGSVAPESNSNAEESSERKQKYQAVAEDLGGAEAMDVDTPPNEKAKAAADATKAKATGTGPVPDGAATASGAAPADKPAATLGLSGLDGLGNVETFFPTTNPGLGLDDLKDNLPFQSGASQSHPTKPNAAQKLKTQAVPVAPPPPARLGVTSTNEYFSRMESYVRQYQTWNKDMVAHFSARSAELSNGLEDRFIHQRGETTKKIGFPGYLARMQEDEKVMETWRVGQELHIKAMLACQDVRNRAMKALIRVEPRIQGFKKTVEGRLRDEDEPSSSAAKAQPRTGGKRAAGDEPLRIEAKKLKKGLLD